MCKDKTMSRLGKFSFFDSLNLLCKKCCPSASQAEGKKTDIVAGNDDVDDMIKNMKQAHLLENQRLKVAEFPSNIGVYDLILLQASLVRTLS